MLFNISRHDFAIYASICIMVFIKSFFKLRYIFVLDINVKVMLLAIIMMF